MDAAKRLNHSEIHPLNVPMTMDQEPVELLLVPGLHSTENAMELARLAMNAPLEQVLCFRFNRQQIAAVLYLVCDQLEQTARGMDEAPESHKYLLQSKPEFVDNRIIYRQKALEMLLQMMQDFTK